MLDHLDTTRITRAIVAGGLGLALAACADPARTPTAAEYDQVARSIGGATSYLGDGTALAVATQLATGVVPIGISLDDTGRFTGEQFGLDYDYAVTCQTLELVPVECGDLTTSAVVDAVWTGTLDLPRMHAEANRTGQWTLAGLSSPTTTVDGTADFELRSTFQSASEMNRKTLDLSYDARYRSVMIDSHTMAYVGGSITYAIDVSTSHTNPGLDDQRSYTIDATITFDGDGGATLVLDGDRVYTVDLATGMTSQVVSD